jgi:tRNA(fMet)-specific endonuclease VapC
MRKYLLDSGPAQGFMHGLSPVKERANNLSQTGAKIGICMPVFAELMGGIELSQTRERNRKILMKAVRKLYVWPFDRVAAEEYGRTYAFLRRSGRPMPAMDIQIAAIALTLGSCTLVTKASDFAAIPGLTIEDWS